MTPKQLSIAQDILHTVPEGLSPLWDSVEVQGEAIPLLHSKRTAGQLEEWLELACGENTVWGAGESGGDFWCELWTNSQTQEWSGQSLGEVLAQALLELWSRLS